MAWKVSPTLAAEIGDDGPWARRLKDAWHACASNAPENHKPSRPTGKSSTADSEHRAREIAYWTPMFHLLIFGLGWTRPDLGLARWREMGFPTMDPILSATMRWWGKAGIEDVLASAAVHDGFIQIVGYVFSDQAGFEHIEAGSRLPDIREWEARRQTATWRQSPWSGGTSAFHLHDHVRVPLAGPIGASGAYATEPSLYETSYGHNQRLLLLDAYPGWYRHLTELPEAPVDVVVRPVGWLGAFHRSLETGLWHRGDHHVHLMGSWV